MISPLTSMIDPPDTARASLNLARHWLLPGVPVLRDPLRDLLHSTREGQLGVHSGGAVEPVAELHVRPESFLGGRPRRQLRQHLLHGLGAEAADPFARVGILDLEDIRFRAVFLVPTAFARDLHDDFIGSGCNFISVHIAIELGQ